MSYQSILPRNATSAEKAFEQAFAKQINAIELERIYEQWDPEQCPAHLLGWLAWALSLDDWDPDWPEQVKRDAISSSLAVHKQKGTFSAVKKAVASLGQQISVIEFSSQTQDLAPHQFSVNLELAEDLSNSGDFGTELYQQIINKVNKTKPARSYFQLQITSNFKQNLVVAGNQRALVMVQAQFNG